MPTLRWILVLLCLLVLFLVNLSVGSISIPVKEILKILLGKQPLDPVWAQIIWDFRMTKAITCILAGSALSVSGLQMQTLFRNALAGPDVLGITSGASLAVSIAYMGGAAGLSSPWGVTLSASLGCITVFLIMIIVSRNLRDNISLLIVGLMIGAGTSSIVSVLQYLSDAEDLQTYMMWTFGSLGVLNWQEIRVLFLVAIAGCSVAFAMSKPLNVWFLGENYVRSLGLNVSSSRLFIILSACILTGGVTAFCGPIAFVGLAVPHLIKIFLGTNNHRLLIPFVMIGGASLLLLCDILAKIPGTNQVLPINAITALFGAPVVIWVIIKKRIAD